MPNWCDNSLLLENENIEKIEDLMVILQKIFECPDGSDETLIGVCEHLRPPPENINPCNDWRLEHWGIKWDMDVQHCERESDNEVIIHFNSPWGPPIELYKYLTENGWKIKAYFHESGMQFLGVYNNHPDTEYVNNYFMCEYDFGDDTWRYGIPQELIEFGDLDTLYSNHLEMLNEYSNKQLN